MTKTGNKTTENKNENNKNKPSVEIQYEKKMTTNDNNNTTMIVDNDKNNPTTTIIIKPNTTIKTTNNNPFGKATKKKNPTNNNTNINNDDNNINKMTTTNNPTNNDPTNNEQKKATKHKTSWNIIVNPTKSAEQISTRRIVGGLLQAIKHKHLKTWMTTHPNHPYDPKEQGITDPNMIPTNKKEAEKYIEAIRTTKHGKLLFRLTFVSDVPMEEIIYDINFRKWLKSQKINMEISELKTPMPHYVGFFDTPLPETKKAKLMKARLDKLYNNRNLPFQIVLAPVYVDGHNNTTKFYMAVADETNVEAVKLMFKSCFALTNHHFFPLDQYLSLHRQQKVKLIQQQNYYYATHRTILINGFTDENPPIDMEPAAGTTMMAEMNTTTTSVNTNLSSNQYQILAEDHENEDKELDKTFDNNAENNC
jgi:hypothetical protein